jgi:hypothetical protein
VEGEDEHRALAAPHETINDAETNMRFDDVAGDGIEIDANSEDRALFCAIETRGEIGDLPVDEAWAILADRYPGDPRLRVLSLYHDLDANGVDAFRDPPALMRAMNALIDAKADREQCAALVAMIAAEVDDRDALAPVERALAPIPEERIARRLLRKLREAVLDEAEEKTREGNPFGERAPSGISAIKANDAPPRPYSPKEPFAVGDRVLHTKFGEGVVVGKGDGKLEVAFPDGPRKLVSLST